MCWWSKPCRPSRRTGYRTLCVGGGVAANSLLRHELSVAAEKHAVRLVIAPPQLCTDNAVMGAIAVERWNAGLTEGLDLDIAAGVLRKARV